MGSFLSGLGSAIGGAAKNYAQHTPIGRAVGAVARYRQQQRQQATGIGTPPGYSDTDPSNMMDRSPVPDQPMDPNQQPPDGGSPMAGGQLVTRPTIALLGENGSEAVIPLNANPTNRTSMPYRGGQR